MLTARARRAKRRHRGQFQRAKYRAQTPQRIFPAMVGAARSAISAVCARVQTVGWLDAIDQLHTLLGERARPSVCRPDIRSWRC